MQTTTAAARSSKTQKLIAVGAVVVLAVLLIQAYALLATGSTSGPGVEKASGKVDPPTNATITVSGTGQVNVQPNTAVITIGVNTQDSSAEAAAQQNANIMSNVVSALEKLGINSSSIETISYSVSQQYYNEYQPPPIPCGKPMNDTSPKCIQGYQVDNEIQVTISVDTQDLSQLGTKVGAAIDAAVSQGANEIYGVQFTASSSAIRQANEQALELAAQDASGQAKSIASALNVTLTGVVSVTTTPAYTPSPIVYTSVAQGATAQTPVLSPQSLTISAYVQVVYAIG